MEKNYQPSTNIERYDMLRMKLFMVEISFPSLFGLLTKPAIDQVWNRMNIDGETVQKLYKSDIYKFTAKI